MLLSLQKNSNDRRTGIKAPRRRIKIVPGGEDAISDMRGKLTHPEAVISFERLAAA